MSTLIADRVEHASPLCDRLVPLRDVCLDAWSATRSELPRLGPGVTRWQQWRNARATGQLIDEIALRVDEHPEQTSEQRVWRDRLRVTLQDFGECRFGWPDGYRRLLFGDAFYESSVAFVRQARAFDSSSTLDDLWQAMRNVWIGNNLQMRLGVPVRLTQGLFAYSMLYPVTDNGDATIDQERFAFGYGVFLQLLDDLQDVTADRINGHHTLFTLAAEAGTVDDLTARLMNFIDVVLDRERAAAGAETSDCLDLIRRNCHCMLATVISAQPAMFSRRFRRSVERQWPLSFRAMRRLRRRAEQRFRSTSQRLQTRRGVSSPLELLLAN